MPFIGKRRVGLFQQGGAASLPPPVTPTILGTPTSFNKITSDGVEFTKVCDLVVPAGTELLVVTAYTVSAGYPVAFYRVRNGGAPVYLTNYSFTQSHNNIYYLINPLETGATDELWVVNGEKNGPFAVMHVWGGYMALDNVDVTGVPIRGEDHTEDFTADEINLTVPGAALDLIVDSPGVYVPAVGTVGTPGAGQTKQYYVQDATLGGNGMATSVAAGASNPVLWTFVNPPAAVCYRGWSIKAKPA